MIPFSWYYNTSKSIALLIRKASLFSYFIFWSNMMMKLMLLVETLVGDQILNWNSDLIGWHLLGQSNAKALKLRSHRTPILHQGRPVFMLGKCTDPIGIMWRDFSIGCGTLVWQSQCDLCITCRGNQTGNIFCPQWWGWSPKPKWRRILPFCSEFVW